MKLVLACLLRLITLEQDYTSTFVTSSKVVSSLIELNRGDYIGFRDIFDVAFVAKAPVTLWLVCKLYSVFEI